MTTSLGQLLRIQAERRSDAVAYRYIDGNANQIESITYGQLHAASERFANGLFALGCRREPVPLLLSGSLAFHIAVFGCALAGAIAVPLYVPRRNRSIERIRSVLRHSKARFAIAPENEALDLLETEASAVRLLTVAAVADMTSASYRKESSASDVAIIQYTSGSTGAPKGVALTNGNLLSNAAAVAKAIDQRPSDTYMSWLPLYHDMGFMSGLLQTVFAGVTATLMEPRIFLARPAAWLEGLSKFGATISGGPSFAYDACAQRITDEELARLDLSRWEVAFCGAEPVRITALTTFSRRFLKVAFSDRALYPCYGLAENTLMVSGSTRGCGLRIDAGGGHPARADTAATPTNAHVSCGSAVAHHGIRIVDPVSGTCCESGERGEIWVSGPSKALGYWNDPESSKETFDACLVDDPSSYLRTGDIGYLLDGELFITGRLKDVINVNGRKIHPEDVETVALEVLQKGGSARVVAIEDEVAGERHVVLLVERDVRGDRGDPRAIAEELAAAISREMECRLDAVAFVRSNSLPLTSSGKPQRFECRRQYATRSLKQILEVNFPREKPLGLTANAGVADVLMNVLTLREPPQSSQTLNELGIDSLTAVHLQAELGRQFGLKIGLVDLLDNCTVAKLTARTLSKHSPKPPRAINLSSGTEERFPLSHIQLAFWHVMGRRSYEVVPGFMLRLAVRFPPSVSAKSLAGALSNCIEQHEMLRAVFGVEEGVPFQRIAPMSMNQVRLAYRETDNLPGPRPANYATQPSHRNAPDIPAVQARITDDIHGPRLELDAHHIQVDGESLWQILREVVAVAVTGEPAKGAIESYRAYVLWQRAMLRNAQGSSLKAFWAREQGTGWPLIDWKAGRVRDSRTGRAASIDITIAGDEYQAWIGGARDAGCTRFAMTLWAFVHALRPEVHCTEIVVGVPAAARDAAAFARTIGCFFNPLPVRLSLARLAAADGGLSYVRSRVIEVLEHQLFPSSCIAELASTKSSRLPPLFQLTANYHRPRIGIAVSSVLPVESAGEEVEEEGAAVQLFIQSRQHVRTDVELDVLDLENRLFIRLHYDAGFVREDVAAGIAQRWMEMVARCATAPRASEAELASSSGAGH